MVTISKSKSRIMDQDILTLREYWKLQKGFADHRLSQGYK